MATRLETAAKKRAAATKSLEAKVKDLAAKRAEFEAEGANEWVGTYSARDGNAPIFDMKTGLRVGIIDGKDKDDVASRSNMIMTERIELAEAAAARVQAVKDDSASANDKIRKQALAAFGKAKPAAKPVADSTEG